MPSRVLFDFFLCFEWAFVVCALEEGTVQSLPNATLCLALCELRTGATQNHTHRIPQPSCTSRRCVRIRVAIPYGTQVPFLKGQVPPITFTVSPTRIRLPVVSVGLCFMILSICAGTLTECSLNLAHGLYQPQTLYERSRFEYLFFLLKVLHTCSNQGEAHRTLGFRSCVIRSGTPSTAEPIFTSASLPLRISTRGLFSTPGHRSRRWACPRWLGSEITGRAGVSGYIIQATTRHPKNLVG